MVLFIYYRATWDAHCMLITLIIIWAISADDKVVIFFYFDHRKLVL